MITWLKKNLKYIIPTVFVVLCFVVPQYTEAACFWPTKECIQGSFEEGFITLLNGFLYVFGLLLSLAGLLLEGVIQLTIVNARNIIMGDGTLPGLQSIDLAWRTIRDVINILFVFVLLYISINIILDSWGNSSYNKSLIPKVIIAALLINFSLFFTKVVFDISNVITFEFYKTAATLHSAPADPTDPNSIQVPLTGISAAIMDGLRMSEIVNDEGKTTETAKGVSGTYALFATVLGIITILVATSIFIVMAVMLLARFIVFIALMITSPIAFLGPLFPALKSHADQWQKALISQATFAPIFFIMILVVVLIISDPSFETALQVQTGTGGTTAAGYLGGLLNVIVQYAIVVGLLIIALVVSKQTANQTGDAFKNLVGKISGGAAFVGRNTVGRAANRVVNSAAVGNLTNSNNALAKGVGRSLVFTGDKVRRSSFNALGGNRVANTLGVETKEYGKVGTPGGFVQARETWNKNRTEEAKKRGGLYADTKARATLRDQIKNAKDQDEKRRAQDALALMDGKLTQAQKDLLESSKKLDATQRAEAEAKQKAIDVQKKQTEELERDIQLETNDEKRKLLERKKVILEREIQLAESDENLSADQKDYLKKKSGVSDIRKTMEGANNQAGRAIGEEFVTSQFRGNRAAAEELLKGKDRTDKEIAEEVRREMKKLNRKARTQIENEERLTNPNQPPKPNLPQ